MSGGGFVTHDQFKKAADYWKNKKQNAMPEEKLKKTVLEYINSNNNCALATGTGDYVRCTPIEYSYHDGKFWMFSEGGEKFIGLEKNENVCPCKNLYMIVHSSFIYKCQNVVNITKRGRYREQTGGYQ